MADFRPWSVRESISERIAEVTEIPDTKRPTATSTIVRATNEIRSGIPRLRTGAETAAAAGAPARSCAGCGTDRVKMLMEMSCLRSAEPDSGAARSPRLPHDVTDATQRVDQWGDTVVELATQVGHIRFDDVDLATEVVVPDMVEDPGL